MTYFLLLLLPTRARLSSPLLSSARALLSHLGELVRKGPEGPHVEQAVMVVDPQALPRLHQAVGFHRVLYKARHDGPVGVLHVEDPATKKKSI